MTIKVKQRDNRKIFIRTNSDLETKYVLQHMAKLKWLPQELRPQIIVKDYTGDEVIIPKPKKEIKC